MTDAEDAVQDTWLRLTGADMFAMTFTEVAAALGRSTEATEQLASRARRRVRGSPNPDRAADLGRQREVATAFLAASRGGDPSALVALLDSDVTLTADASAAPSGKLVRLRGADMASRGAIASAGRAAQSRLALVDGQWGSSTRPPGGCSWYSHSRSAARAGSPRST